MCHEDSAGKDQTFELWGLILSSYYLQNSSRLVKTEPNLSFFGQRNARHMCESRRKDVIKSFENPVRNLLGYCQ